jgi:hypothetical protein
MTERAARGCYLAAAQPAREACRVQFAISVRSHRASTNRIRTRAPLLLVVLLFAPGAATAEPAHAVYAELLGKGGLWGLGYDYRLRRRITVGVVASAYSLDGQRVVSLSPYLGASIARGGPHSWFLDAGPQAVYTWTPSPIPEWDGDSAAGIGAGVSSGYEYRARILVRLFAQGVVGRGGATPWLGAGVGWTF